jgi:hypothetical protein
MFTTLTNSVITNFGYKKTNLACPKLLIITEFDCTNITTVALNGITLGLRQTDYINQMKPLMDTHFGSLTVLITHKA